MKIMRQIRKLLRSRSGETLTETLVSVLIISIVSVAFAAMVSTASKMNVAAKEFDEAIDRAEETLQSSTGTPGQTVTFSLDGVAGSGVSFDNITIKSAQINSSTGLYSYEYEVKEETDSRT